MSDVLYEVGLDKNGDGYICFDARPDDPLNLLPGGVQLAAMGSMPVGEVVSGLGLEESPYGVQYFDLSFTGAGNGAHYVGRVADTISSISVSAGLTYSAGVWVRGDADYSGLSLTFSAYTSTLDVLATTQLSPASDWLRLQLTFTIPTGETHVAFALATTQAMTIRATGYMLVTGDTLPDGYNSGDPLDLDDFITADVLDMRWKIGLSDPYDTFAMPTRGQLTLWNKHRQFSPELSSLTLAPGTIVRVRAIENAVTSTLFTGYIAYVEVETGDLGGRKVVIHLHGPEDVLSVVRVLSPLKINVRAGEILTQILREITLLRFTLRLDEGVSVFAYVGDTWAGGILAEQALRQIVAAERGRFFSNREGHLVFHDRDHTYGASQAVFEDAFAALHYTYGEGLVNRVRVVIRPRAVGAPGSVMWQLTTAQRIPPMSCRTIIARLRDANGDTVGALSIVDPVAGVDYAANSAPDGSGTDVTAQVVVFIAEDGSNGSAITLEVCNNTAADAYLLAGAQLRGTPLYQRDSLLIQAQNVTSMLKHGPHPLEFNLPYFVTVDEADALATTALSRRLNPVGQVKTLRLSHQVRLPDALRLTLFDRITIRESHTGHDADYLIIAESHEVDLAGQLHYVTWTLEPADQA